MKKIVVISAMPLSNMAEFLNSDIVKKIEYLFIDEKLIGAFNEDGTSCPMETDKGQPTVHHFNLIDIERDILKITIFSSTMEVEVPRGEYKRIFLELRDKDLM